MLNSSRKHFWLKNSYWICQWYSGAYFNEAQSQLYLRTLIIRETLLIFNLNPFVVMLRGHEKTGKHTHCIQCIKSSPPPPVSALKKVLYNVWSHALVFPVNTGNILASLVFITWYCTVCVTSICFNVVCKVCMQTKKCLSKAAAHLLLASS